MPKRRSLWPFRPKTKFTDERSGSLRLASPPASLGDCAARAPVAETSAVMLNAPSFDELFKMFESQMDQAFCSQVRMKASSKTMRSDFLQAAGALRFYRKSRTFT